jgi:hypothetical protein
MVPTSTLTPANTAMAVPLPTATALPTFTLEPTLVPTPVRQPTGNLVPFAPRMCDASIIVTSTRADDPSEVNLNTEVYAGEDTFISWAVTNLGPLSINQTFFVDLMLYGVVIKRWTSERGGSRNGNYFVDN